MLKKVIGGWEVLSHTTGRSFGTYKTKREAQKRLRQIKMFGEMKRHENK